MALQLQPDGTYRESTTGAIYTADDLKLESVQRVLGTTSGVGGETVTEDQIRAIFDRLGVPYGAHTDGTFEDPDARIARLVSEVNAGRSLESIEAALIDYVAKRGTTLGSDAEIESQIRAIFDKLGIPYGWHSDGTFEDPDARIARLVREVKAGRTLADIEFQLQDALSDVGGFKVGVLHGGRLVKVDRAGLLDTYAFVYQIPGSDKYVAFVVEGGAKQLSGILGPTWISQLSGTVADQWWDQNVLAETADLSLVLGAEGTWNAVWGELVSNAGLAAGSADPTILGQLFSDPEIQSILAQALIGNFTDQQLTASLRNSTAYKTILFPGIETFIQMGSANPEDDWAQYFDTVRAASAQAGITVDRAMIAQLLRAGVSEQAYAASIPMYVRASQSEGFFNTFSQWVGAELGRTLDFETWLDFLEGKAPADLYAVYEKATLQFAAEQVAPGLAGQASLIERIAEGTDLSEAAARSSFLNAGQLVRQLDRAILLNKYGLTDDDLVALEFGIAPASGRSLDEVARRTRQAIEEEKLLGAPKQSFFVGFDERGIPTRPGLAPLAPLGG